MSNVQFTSITTDEGQQFITVFANGKLQPPVDDTHPNFDSIKALCLDAMDGIPVDVDHLIELFDVEQTIREKFERLSDRVAVKNGVITLDGDPVHGTLQDQILAFLDAGEEFEPLVRFYEKMLTNPLGNVQAGLYTWIAGQKADGNFTITPEGDILGYKSVKRQAPEWRDAAEVFVPSRRGEGIVNGVDVRSDQFIEQIPGDVVEMPRSRVLNAPSRDCGDGLHIGTFAYAKTFYGGDTVMLVKFSPRDIVSLPNSDSSWKLRVCRYEVVKAVEQPLEVPVWSPGVENPAVEYGSGDEIEPGEVDLDLSLDSDEEDTQAWTDSTGTAFSVGTRVVDEDGDEGVVTGSDSDGDPVVKFDDAAYGEEGQYPHDLTVVADPSTPTQWGEGDRGDDWSGDPFTVEGVHSDGSVDICWDDKSYGDNGRANLTTADMQTCKRTRIHGKGGPTSQATKGSGRNPAQDEKGRFSNGRPNSQRDSGTGRFVG